MNAKMAVGKLVEMVNWMILRITVSVLSKPERFFRRRTTSEDAMEVSVRTNIPFVTFSIVVVVWFSKSTRLLAFLTLE